MADAKDIIKASERFDLVFKYALAKAWTDGNAAEIREAEEAYLEMVRSRNGFYEAEPFRDKPEDFIGAFRKTAASIRERGFDMSRPPIPIDRNGEVLDGAHRLAACAAYGKPCAVATNEIWPAGGSVYRTFVKGHMHPAVREWGKRKYLQHFPDGKLAAQFAGADKASPLPFPDWEKRARRAWPQKLKPLFALIWCTATLPLKKAEKREKQLRRMLRERKKLSGYGALAEYWRNRKNHVTETDA